MAGRDRAGLALAVLALAALATTPFAWTRICSDGACGDVSAWSHAIGSAIGLLAAALLVYEALPLLHLGVERPLLGAALGLAVAATIGILVGFELADVDNYGGGTIWIGTWVGSVLAVVLVLAGLARLRALRREPPDPRWLDALFVAGGGLAFASTFMPWAVAAHHLGGPGADAWWGGGIPAAAFGLAAVAVVGAEAFRFAGLRPLVPATIVLAGLTAIFCVLSVIIVVRQLGKFAVLGLGAWLALAASAALIVGAVLRRREFRLD
ncbi:MAG: hypothetical protein ACXVZN_10585 [Gaiellaceae bacterium]